MGLPEYIETQWYDEGKGKLKFSPDAKDPEDGEITCFLSSLIIWEYERKLAGSDDKDLEKASDSSFENIVDSQTSDANVYIKPPEVSDETWRSWLVYWEAWKDIYIPLAWVQTNRKLCKQSSVEWHDSYIIEYPWILALIREGLEETKDSLSFSLDDHQEEVKGDDSQTELVELEDSKGEKDQEETITEEVSPERRKELDRMYDQFSDTRYWIHLKVFLQNCGVKPSEKVKEFFKEHAGLDYTERVVEIESDIIPDFMKDSGDVILDKENAEVAELNEKAKERENLVEVAATDYKEKENTLTLKDEKSTSEEPNQMSGEEMDKIGIKRRQEDLKEEVCSEEIEAEKSSASKRSRPNPLLEKNRNNVKEKQLGPNTDSDIDYDYDLDSDDKENADMSVKSNKKASKHKKKRTSQRHQGLAWVMQYLDKNDSGNAAPTQRNQVNGNSSPSSPSKSNIFSVERCELKDVGQVEELSSFANLSSDDYEFSVDRLNLKEDSSELSKCFLSRGDSSISNDRANSDQKIITAQVLKEAMAVTKSTLDDSDECTSELSEDDGDEASKDDEDESGGGEDDEFGEGEDDESDGSEECESNQTTAGENEKAMSLTSVPGPLGILKNFVMMTTAHLFSYILPVITGPLSILRHVLAHIPFINNLLSFSRSKEILKQKKKQCQKKLEKWLEQVSNVEVCPSPSNPFKGFYRCVEEREKKSLYQSIKQASESDGTSYVVVNTLDLLSDDFVDKPQDEGRDWQRVHIKFDEDGNPVKISETLGSKGSSMEEVEIEDDLDDLDEYQREKCTWKKITDGYQVVNHKVDKETPPAELPKYLHRYWAQRHRLFLRYDEGIKLDMESWYSVTPEMIAAHHAYRLRCDVVVDAFCGAGGNAIQLASTCNKVIAIDIDPAKIELARHNAAVYGVEKSIKFIVGDFLKLAPTLKADVVLLSPPWGGTEYKEEKIYNVKRLGGVMDCEAVMSAAKGITHNIALYLPRTSNLCQVIEFAGIGGSVDLEYNNMGYKRKALTAYYGDLVHY